MGERAEFAVLGAGLAGPLAAIYLARAGYRVDLYERRGDPRVAGTAGGRSINLALSLRGIAALREVGLAEEVLRQAIPMRGRMLHPVSGELAFQPYSVREGEHINSVSRGGLQTILVEAAAKYASIRMFFDHKCVGIDLERAEFDLARGANGEAVRGVSDRVVAADGAFSVVRREMQRLDRFQFSQQYLEHGYKELCIPPGPGGTFRIEKNALHIWPRRSYMMIALPNIDGSFTCTLFAPWEGPNGFASLRTEADVRRYFAERFPDAVPLMPTLVEDFLGNPTGSLATMRCEPWNYRDRVALLGDAAHAVVPFYGQGMNASFEDCRVLNECVAAHRPNWERVFSDYACRRKVNTDALARLAIENFVEMRDKVGSRAFLWRKHAEHWLHKAVPWWFVPLYSMVTFSELPYAEAERRAKWQDVVLAWVLSVLFVIMFAAAGHWLLGLRMVEGASLAALVVSAWWTLRGRRQKSGLRAE